MASLLRRTPRILPSLSSTPLRSTRTFATSPLLAIQVDASFIRKITAAEKTLTHSDEPVEGGPTAIAQAHLGQPLTAQVISAITAGEKAIIHRYQPAKGGPTSVAQRILVRANKERTNNTAHTSTKAKSLPGSVEKQAHHDHPTSQVLHDITVGEKKITGGDRIKGGPTSTVQRELAKAKQK